MNRNIISTLAVIVGLGLAGTAIAQGRHDEKPHGYDKAKAEAAAATTQSETPAATGGRHDERPHNVKKTKATPKATDAKPTDAKSVTPKSPDGTPTGTQTATTPVAGATSGQTGK
jgi:hypothetical protein